MASPTFGRLYPGENTRYSFYRRLSEPQDQSGHEGMEKNVHPYVTRGRTRARSQAPCHLSYTIQIKCLTWQCKFDTDLVLCNLESLS